MKAAFDLDSLTSLSPDRRRAILENLRNDGFSISVTSWRTASKEGFDSVVEILCDTGLISLVDKIETRFPADAVYIADNCLSIHTPDLEKALRSVLETGEINND